MNDTKIYPHPLEYAKETGQLEAYWGSAKANRECAAAIDKAIIASNYELYHYDLSEALNAVTKEFGLDRVAWVVADVIQANEHDGRYSRANKEWAQDASVPRERTQNFTLQSHPIVLDGFADKVRQARLHNLAQTVGAYEKSHHMAERNRLTSFDGDKGCFIANRGVSEQRLTERCAEIAEKQSLRAARKAEKADGQIPPSQSANYLQTAEMGLEQNYNQIDGIINNQEPPRVIQGYAIIDSAVVGHKEFVLGESKAAPQPFVTWVRNIQKDEQMGGENFFWGHYFTDPDRARKDFHSRVHEEEQDLAEQHPSILSQLKADAARKDLPAAPQPGHKKDAPVR